VDDSRDNSEGEERCLLREVQKMTENGEGHSPNTDVSRFGSFGRIERCLLREVQKMTENGARGNSTGLGLALEYFRLIAQKAEGVRACFHKAHGRVNRRRGPHSIALWPEVKEERVLELGL
jgi:hypothetical protein